MNSKLKTAKEFKKFIFKDLLPSFRKHIHQKYLDIINNKQDKIDELLIITKKLSLQNNELLYKHNQALEKLEDLGISLNESREENKELLHEVKEISNQLDITTDKLEMVLEDRNIKPSCSSFQHKYLLLKSKTENNKYVFIRSQSKYIKKI